MRNAGGVVQFRLALLVLVAATVAGLIASEGVLTQTTAATEDEETLATIIRGVEYRASRIQEFQGRMIQNAVHTEEYLSYPGVDAAAAEEMYALYPMAIEWARTEDRMRATYTSLAAERPEDRWHESFHYQDDQLRILRRWPSAPRPVRFVTGEEMSVHMWDKLYPYEIAFLMRYLSMPLGAYLRRNECQLLGEKEIGGHTALGLLVEWSTKRARGPRAGEPLVMQTVFWISPDLGFAAVRHEDIVKESRRLVLQVDLTDFTEVDAGLWLARRSFQQLWTNPDMGSAMYVLSSTRESVVVDWHVNEPIPDEAFELEVPDEAWIVDYAEGRWEPPKAEEE